jgi:hypothetical protein
MLKGVNAILGIKNQSIRLTIQPILAGKHIIQENKVPKCSDILVLQSLKRSNILNGPLPKTTILDNPYTANMYKKIINTLLIG